MSCFKSLQEPLPKVHADIADSRYLEQTGKEKKLSQGEFEDKPYNGDGNEDVTKQLILRLISSIIALHVRFARAANFFAVLCKIKTSNDQLERLPFPVDIFRNMTVPFAS